MNNGAALLFAPLLLLGCPSDGDVNVVLDADTDAVDDSASSGAFQTEGPQDEGEHDGGSSTGDGGSGVDTALDDTTGSTGSGDEPGTGSDESTGSGSGGMELPPGFETDCDPDDFGVWVDGAGYSTIQGGIDGAAAGETVYVCPGTYVETLQIERSVEVIGAGAELVTVEGGVSARVVDIDPADATLVNEILLQGMTVHGGATGVYADTVFLELRELTVTESTQHGVELDRVVLDATELTVTNVNSTVHGAGLEILLGSASLTDCVIEDNVTTTIGGGMYISTAEVTVTGGRVRRNAATEGGGAFLAQDSTALASLTIVNSDWGTGELEENNDEDVWCGAITFVIGDTSSSWLDDDASAVCSSGNGDVTCCE